MAASLEVRAPFLDTEVVEYALRLPASYKLRAGRTKVVLKSALRGLVPEEILHRPKKGFGIPVAAWIRGPLRPMFEDLFSPSSLQRSGVLDPGAGRALLDRHLAGAADLRKPLWTIASFLLWQRRWGATDLEVERAMPGDELVPLREHVGERPLETREGQQA